MTTKESSHSAPVFVPEESDEWQDGRWHVWVRHNGSGWFVYRVGADTKSSFWPGASTRNKDYILTVSNLGAAVTMCDLLNEGA